MWRINGGDWAGGLKDDPRFTAFSRSRVSFVENDIGLSSELLLLVRRFVNAV